MITKTLKMGPFLLGCPNNKVLFDLEDGTPHFQSGHILLLGRNTDAFRCSDLSHYQDVMAHVSAEYCLIGSTCAGAKGRPQRR